jgi:hypothetical protein
LKNSVAVIDVLSRVPTSRLVREKTAGPGEKNLISQPNQPQELYKDNQACKTEENPLLAECLVVYPVFDKCDVTCHPFHFATMRHYQQRSDATKQLLINQPEQYALVTLGETDLICYIVANLQHPKIVLTDDMLPWIVCYYHLTAQHAKGMDRLERLLKQHFYHLAPSQRRSPLASQSMQNMSENEALQYQLCTSSCPRGQQVFLGNKYTWISSVHGTSRSKDTRNQCNLLPY